MFYPHVGVVAGGGQDAPGGPRAPHRAAPPGHREPAARRAGRGLPRPARAGDGRGGAALARCPSPTCRCACRTPSPPAAGLTPERLDRAASRSPAAARSYRLDLQALYDEGDVSQNWLLQDGDVLHVPIREENKVFVLGEVKQALVEADGEGADEPRRGDRRLARASTRSPRTRATVYVIRGRYEAPARLQARRLERRRAAARGAVPARAARRGVRLRRTSSPTGTAS